MEGWQGVIATGVELEQTVRQEGTEVVPAGEYEARKEFYFRDYLEPVPSQTVTAEPERTTEPVEEQKQAEEQEVE